MVVYLVAKLAFWKVHVLVVKMVAGKAASLVVSRVAPMAKPSA